MTLPGTYDELVAASPQGSLFAHRWWLEAVAPGAYEILELRNGEGLQAAWPVVSRQTDLGREAYMPPLSQKLGMLFAPSTAKAVELQSRNQRLAGELLEQLPPMAAFHQNFHEGFTDWLPFHWAGYSQTTRYTYILDDISDSDAVWEGLRPHHRQAIRKAEKLGVRVVDDLSLDDFIALNRKTFARQSREPLAADAVIRRVDEQLLANAGRRIFAGVGEDGAVHAAVYVAWADGVAYYLMGGGEPELRDSAAQLLALWRAVQEMKGVARRFDFEGSMLPQVERVFRGFGAVQTPYFTISRQPPAPSGLGGYVQAAIDFRLRPVKRLLKRGRNS